MPIRFPASGSSQLPGGWDDKLTPPEVTGGSRSGSPVPSAMTELILTLSLQMTGCPAVGNATFSHSTVILAGRYSFDFNLASLADITSTRVPGKTGK